MPLSSNFRGRRSRFSGRCRLLDQRSHIEATVSRATSVFCKIVSRVGRAECCTCRRTTRRTWTNLLPSHALQVFVGTRRLTKDGQDVVRPTTMSNAQLLFIGIISNNIPSLDPSFDYRLESAPNDHASHVKVAFQDSIGSLLLNGYQQ